MKLKIVKIVEIVCTCLAGLLVLGFSFFIFQKVASEDKPIQLLGVSIHEVSNDDLKDENAKKSIDKGDLLVTISTKKYKENDVILYKANNSYYVRRVFSFNNNQLMTESHIIDGTEGNLVELHNVLGKKVFLFNNYANFRQIALNPTTIIILGVLFFGGLIACFVLEKVFSKTKENNETE